MHATTYKDGSPRVQGGPRASLLAALKEYEAFARRYPEQAHLVDSIGNLREELALRTLENCPVCRA